MAEPIKLENAIRYIGKYMRIDVALKEDVRPTGTRFQEFFYLFINLETGKVYWSTNKEFDENSEELMSEKRFRDKFTQEYKFYTSFLKGGEEKDRDCWD